MNTPQGAYDFLVDYMNRNGGNYRLWYAGIATDARDRLFRDHSVTENGGYWAHDSVATSAQARDVEEALLRLGCDGGGGGGSHTSRSIYVYLKSRGTNP